MREQEFRQALHQALRHASMRPGQQEQVLEEVNRQRRSRWVRQLLIPAMAALLCLSAAVAGRLGAVNWNGEPVAVQEGTLLADRPGGSRLQELCNAVDDRLAFYIRGPAGASISYTSSCYPSSLEDMAQQVLAAGALPWPVQLPEGYSLTLGRLSWVMGISGSFQTEEAYVTEDGYQVWTLRLPDEQRQQGSYMLRLSDGSGNDVTISAALTSGGERRFNVEEGGASQTLTLPGMERAIAIVHPGRTEVHLLRRLTRGVTYRVPEVNPRGAITSQAAFFSHLTLTLTSTVHTPDQLLAMMGLAFAP